MFFTRQEAVFFYERADKMPFLFWDVYFERFAFSQSLNSS